jgi:hypothetical protein
LSENLAPPEIEPGTSGSVARVSEHKITQEVGQKERERERERRQVK